MSSIASSQSGINKIHINNSTKMTLSDRFTAFSARPKIQARANRKGVDSPVSRATSIANRRLLKQLAQKHTREAALKLKRRSMKTRPPTTAAYSRVTNGQPLKRGSIKALRLGPAGRLLKANSITKIATMEADFLGGRNPRRSNSMTRISDRIGTMRTGAASRRGGRPMWRMNPQLVSDRTPPPPMRSRSRSRTRGGQAASNIPRRSSQQRFAGRVATRPVRSNSRSRPPIRSRSRSNRNPTMMTDEIIDVDSLPITSRLGRRPMGGAGNRARSASRSRVYSRQPMRGGAVATGRIQKRRNSVKAVTTRGASLAGGIQNRLSRPKGRLTNQRLPTATSNQRLNNAQVSRRNNDTRGRIRGRGRSRSRTDNRILQRNNTTTARSAATNKQRGALRGRATLRGNGRRGRSAQRGTSTSRGVQRNGTGQLQRGGRSRSRGRGSARGGRQLGTDSKLDVKKEDLDKELDQYMSSTKAADGLFS